MRSALPSISGRTLAVASASLAIGLLGLTPSAPAQTSPEPSSSTSTTTSSTTSSTVPKAAAKKPSCEDVKNHGAYVSAQARPSGPGGRSEAAKSDCGKPKPKPEPPKARPGVTSTSRPANPSIPSSTMVMGTTTKRPRHDDHDDHDADEQHRQGPPPAQQGQGQQSQGQPGRSDEHHEDGDSGHNPGSGRAGAPGQLKKQR